MSRRLAGIVLVSTTSAEARLISVYREGYTRLDARFRALALFGWCLAWLVVAWAMLDPAPPAIKHVSEKTIHFASFVAVSFAALTFCRSVRQLALAGAVCAVAGVGFETAQYFIPGRAFEPGDIAANVGGAVTGILLAALSLGLLQRLARPSRRQRAGRRTA